YILLLQSYNNLTISYCLKILFVIEAEGFVIRIFIIFNDCTNHSFFKRNRMNRVVGTITGIITLFPYEKWKRNHAIHHATSGNLDKIGTGDVWVMTVDEYFSASV